MFGTWDFKAMQQIGPVTEAAHIATPSTERQRSEVASLPAQNPSKGLPTSFRFCPPAHFFRLAFLPHAFQYVLCFHGKNIVFSAFLYPELHSRTAVWTREEHKRRPS